MARFLRVTSLILLALLAGPAAAAVATVPLGDAAPFAILAGAGITNTGGTMVVGDVGTHPTPAQTGFGPGPDNVAIVGTNHHDDSTTVAGKAALVAAYEDAQLRPGGIAVVGGELGGMTLLPGVYADDGLPNSLSIGGTLTLDAQGDPEGRWIFQSASTLVAATMSQVVLLNGAQACNVFWQVGSSATVEPGSQFVGTILARASITLMTGASIDGRALARDGAVTMDTNAVRIVPCGGGADPPVPEMGALALFAAGLVTMGLVTRRYAG